MFHPETPAEWEDVLANAGDKLVVCDYNAPWCPPCQMMRPVFHSLPESYPDIIFVDCDVDKLADLDEVDSIEGVPTFRLYKSGE